MKDLIERQAVLDLINENWYASNGFYLNHIMKIPSIDDISVRHGKWIHRGCGIFACSKCGKDVGLNVYTGEKASETFKWCPFCGATAELEKKGDLFSVKIRHGNDCLLFPVKIPPTFGWEAITRKWNTRAGQPKKHYLDD